MQKVITDLMYTLLQFSRSWQSVFFTMVFPLLFLILAWYMPGQEVSSTGADFFDYTLPGIVGIAVMGSSLDLTVGLIVNYRETGLLRKLAVTPLSQVEWILARAAAGVIIALLAGTVSVAIAWLAFGVTPVVNILTLLLVVAGSVTFTGLGMIIAYVIRDGDTASAASFTITLPLILVSGSLFPAERLPGLLQAVAAVSPLTYLNEGLRCTMVTGNITGALANLAVIAGTGAVLLCTWVVTLKWGKG